MKRLLAAMTAVAVLTLVGCATLPTSGAVEEVPLSAQPPGIDVAPEPPADGVLPGRLVEGFLQAMADPSDDYAVARQYLTGDAARVWEPTSAVIYNGSVSSDNSAAGIDGLLLGRLDSGGHYTAANDTFTFDFGVVEENGQWRIGTPPAGLLLSSYIFDRYYSLVSLYYMARAGTHVVPEAIHLPETLVTPTSVVLALLEGPSPTIELNVSNAIPASVGLGPERATIDAQGVVTVDLTGLSDDLSTDARRRLGAQLIWSLTSVARMTGLVVTVDGMPYALPGATADGVLELSGQQGYQVLSRGSSPDLYGVRQGVAGQLSEAGDLIPISPRPDEVSEVAISLDGVSLAYVDTDRTRLLIGSSGGELTSVETGLTNLRHPQYVLGTLYVMGDEDGVARIAEVDRSGTVEMLDLDLPNGAVLAGFAVSPTQARLALVVQTASERSLGVVGLLPDGTSTTPWQKLELVSFTGQELTDVHAVAWQAELSLAVLATGASIRSVYTTEVDGSLIEDLGPVSTDVDDISAMARLGGGNVAIRTGLGVVWRYEARTRWTRVADEISAISYSS